MDAVSALAAIGEPVATRSQLLAAGSTPRALTVAVRNRQLVRVREGYYALPSADPMLLQAVRIGGRLGHGGARRYHTAEPLRSRAERRAGSRLDPARLLNWIVAWTGLSAAWFIEDGDDDGAVIDMRINALARSRLA